jgi:hypothetical protein
MIMMGQSKVAANAAFRRDLANPASLRGIAVLLAESAQAHHRDQDYSTVAAMIVLSWINDA